MSKAHSSADQPTSIQPQQISPEQLLHRKGTVPFLGLTDPQSASYPDPVSPVGARFVTDTPRSFKEAISILPQAGEGRLWADNEFVSVADDGSVSVDIEAIRNVHGLDVDELEAEASASLEDLVDSADPEPLIEVTDHKDIIDRRRLALNTVTDHNIKFRWQIASRQYEPGDMQTFLTRKIVACQKKTDGRAFGWIDHYDWGGAVTITTIYPGMEHTVGLPDDVDIDADGSLTISDAGDPHLANSDDSDDDLTIYYGDRLGYDFRGSQTLWAYPVIYIPEESAMIQLPEPKFKRRHVGDFMDSSEERSNGRVPPVEWHEDILKKIDRETTTINKDIIRARLLAIDFGDVPFEVEQFYTYLGIPQEYAEIAADRATALAASTGFNCPEEDCDWAFDTEEQLRQHHSAVHNKDLDELDKHLEPVDFPHPGPSLWNLQLSLKLALMENFDGARAGDTFQTYQELSGQILKHPQHQLKLAYREHDRRSDDDDDQLVEDDNENQQSLGETLDDMIDLPGITEDSIDATEAQQISQQVQKQLDGF